ncbi:MAG: flagellar basal body P-ring formation chaperone FlgA [Gammaproteobacteria bacterium]|nr:flagellar basal body P-ring formation chaperone FlgA [Gammaproteobacteria bacterium]
MPINIATIVRKLTPTARWRRDIDAQTRRFVCIGLVVIIHIASGASAAGNSNGVGIWHSTADIAAVAEAFLMQRLGKTSQDTAVRAGMLDGRLKLAACSAPLEGFLRPSAKIGPKTIVGIRCNGSKPWKIYVPVDVVVRTEVWVARQPLPKGHLLTKEDLTADVRDVSRMTAGYVSDPNTLIGQRLRSSVLAGRILTLKLIEANNVVMRGQTVTLVVSGSGLQIRMTGKALMDGALNQRIRVENLTSGRIVEGIVRSRELVEVLMPSARDSAGNNSHLAPKVSAAVADTTN